MKRVLLFFLLLNLFVVNGCRSKKAHVAPAPEVKTEVATKHETSNKFFSEVISHKNQSDALWFNSEVDYKDDQRSVDLNMEVYARRNQFVFINVKAMGLVNVARVMFQPDSVRILDMINRTYISASYKYLERFTSAKPGFYEIQNITWANALFDPNSQYSSVDTTGVLVQIITSIASIQQVAAYNAKKKTISVALTEQSKPGEMRVLFNDLRNYGAIEYPKEIEIHIQGQKKLDCKFTINNFATEIRKEPQFVVPKSYKVQVY